MSECGSSDQFVSVVAVVIVNPFLLLLSNKLLLGFASNFVCIFLGLTPTSFVKFRVLSLFMELSVILWNFYPILKNNTLKPPIGNH